MKNKQKIQEMTSTSGSGSFYNPLTKGIRIWRKHTLSPYEIPVSNYDDPTLNYDSLDGSLDVSKKTAKKMERTAKKNAVYNELHPTQNDESVKKRTILEMESNRREKLKDLVKPGEWVDVKDVISQLRGEDLNDVHTVNEDLAVWFGKKKKGKGSSQPQGPWVNICRKDKDGGHPPCGRKEADDKGYPKCRAKSVASRMTDSQKKSACAQKRRVEKTHSKSGTGNKPKMVSYKPRKESIDRLVNNILEQLKK